MMKLYEVGIVEGANTVWTCVVAPTEERAVEFIREHHEQTEADYDAVKIGRIDDTLAGHERLGLENMLETAPVGFASRCTGLGWLAHTGALHRLRLFKIVEQAGTTTFVIAPSADIASALWGASLEVEGDRCTRLYRIFDGLRDLPLDRRVGLDKLLEFGPLGVAHWTRTGWSLLP